MQVKRSNKIGVQFKYKVKTENPSTTAESFPTVGIIKDYLILSLQSQAAGIVKATTQLNGSYALPLDNNVTTVEEKPL